MNAEALNLRAEELVDQHLGTIQKRTDRLFAILLMLQWLGAIAAALTISPYTWAGSQSSVHIHVWVAVGLGALLTAFPVYLAFVRSGETVTRHTIAIAQMLFSALLIHLTGGRIETHFHVFGSLALLAAYRDWRVLATATVVVAADHGLRGAIWPESVYGVNSAVIWRTLEHSAWVVFENIFLIITIRQSLQEMRNIGHQQALLENANRITEMQVAERTADLREAQQRLKLIIDGVPNGVLMIDKLGTIEFANPNAEILFGYGTGKLAGLPIQNLIPEIHPQLDTVFASDSNRDPGDWSLGSDGELQGIRANQDEFPLQLGINRMQTEDGVFVLVSVNDISERKAAEVERQQHALQLEMNNRELTRIQDELKTRNQELDEFTYVASHDLQEPVRKLVSFSSLLQQDLGDDLNEQARRDLGFIVDAAGRMRQLVQDLLALSRTGRSAMKRECVSIAKCVDDALHALQIRIEETGAQIELGEFPEVLGDPTMLTQLFQNLIGNALKFMADDAPEITLTVEDGGDHWILGVQDNGIGMKPEYADRIFKPFQRLHSRDQYEGTGIGLSICKKTVERHQGELWVETQPGEGAHFKFSLPKTLEQPCLNQPTGNPTELQSC